MDTRMQICQEARTWIGTPYRHFQCCKGAGVDCAHLIIGVGKNVGLLHEDFEVPFYPSQWHIHEKSDLLLSTLELNGFTSKDPKSLLPADICVFEIENRLCHTGIYIGGNLVVHAYLSRGIQEVQEFRLTEKWRQRYLKRIYNYPKVDNTDND